MLEKGFGNQTIDKNKKNYELLARSYQGSREWKSAIAPLNSAAKLSDDGNVYVQLCQSYMSERQYAQAESACKQALDKGNLRNTGSTWMLLGSVYYSRDNYQGALEAFGRATRFDETRTRAQKWVKFLEDDIADQEARAVREAERKARLEAEEAAAEEGRVR